MGEREGAPAGEQGRRDVRRARRKVCQGVEWGSGRQSRDEGEGERCGSA